MLLHIQNRKTFGTCAQRGVTNLVPTVRQGEQRGREGKGARLGGEDAQAEDVGSARQPRAHTHPEHLRADGKCRHASKEQRGVSCR